MRKVVCHAVGRFVIALDRCGFTQSLEFAVAQTEEHAVGNGFLSARDLKRMFERQVERRERERKGHFGAFCARASIPQRRKGRDNRAFDRIVREADATPINHAVFSEGIEIDDRARGPARVA